MTHLTTHTPTHGWGCFQKSSNRIEISWFVLSHFNWFGGPPWGCVGWVSVGGCGVGWFTDFKSSNRIEISWFVQVLSHFNWFGGPPWEWVGCVGVGVGVGGCRVGWFTDFKSSNRIELSWFVQFLLTFDWFQGSPLWGVGVGGYGWESVRVCGEVSHACIHVHVHACMHAHMCEQWCHNGNSLGKHITSMGAAICMKLSCLTCMCVHVCMHEISPTYPDRLPPPPPQGGTPEMSQKSIKIEQIEIFQFCLKIFNLCTLVHTYRLYLGYRWGVSYHK